MRTMVAMLMCSGFLVMQSTFAQESAPNVEKQMSDLKNRMGELERNLGAVKQRIALAGGREKGAGVKDTEMAQLQQTADAAMKAVEDKIHDKLMADPDGAKILNQMDENKTKITELQIQLKDMEKSLGPVAQKLGLTEARGKREAGTPEDADVAALRKTADEARKAVENKARERLSADPEGGKILFEIDVLSAKIKDLQSQMSTTKKGTR